MTRLVLIVSGASRGLGRAIAKAFCKDPHFQEIRAFLVARSAHGLSQTEQEMTALATEQQSRPSVKCSRHVVDLGDLDTLDQNLDAIFELVQKDCAASKPDRVVLINNAGSLGHIGPSLSSPSLADMRHTVDLNITSALWLTTRFGRFCQSVVPEAISTIVNISSLVAIQVFPTMSIYSAGKAARDQYHAVLANEIKEQCPNIRVLNYAPGPLETDMTAELRSAEGLDESIQPAFQKQLVDPNDSARVLVRLLVDNSFESGRHIDYYDEKPA